MSWMLVAGKVYHCTNCSGHVQVEYEGGSALTQVSDVVIDQQSEMLDEFAQPNADPDTKGYYLQEKITCEECYVKLGVDESDANRLMLLLDEVNAAINHVAAQVYALCENPTQEDIEEFIGKSAFDEISGRSMLPARKQRKLNDIFQSGRCSDEYLSRHVAAEIGKLSKPLPDVQLKKLSIQLHKKYLTIYVPKEIWVAENTNPFIQSEHTVRVPSSSTPKIRVIAEGVIDLDEFKRKDYFIDNVLEILHFEMPNLVDTFKQMAIKHFIGAVS